MANQISFSIPNHASAIDILRKRGVRRMKLLVISQMRFEDVESRSNVSESHRRATR
jgi:hypothetical protein